MTKHNELTTELRALNTCVQALQPLTPGEKQRVMRFLYDRYIEHQTVSAVRTAPEGKKPRLRPSISTRHTGRASKILEVMSDGKHRTSKEIGQACKEPHSNRLGASLAALVSSGRLVRAGRGVYAMTQQ